MTGGTTAGGSDNSLADVAQYYYVTDLRPDLPDNVFVGSGIGNEDDRMKSQHMTTFAVGLGVSGTLNFNTAYQSGAGDFAGIRAGAVSWPVWPLPVAAGTTPSDASFNDPRSIDDFWHAAVDGRGRFFSARDPGSLIFGITGALTSISSNTGSGAGVTLMSQTPTSGTNGLFATSFVTGQWTGDVTGSSFNASGLVTTCPATVPACSWSAMTQLDALVSTQCDSRNIWLIHKGASNNLVPFTWNTSNCASPGAPTTALSSAEQAWFGSTAVGNLSQYLSTGSSTSAAQLSAAAGPNLVNFLRGQKGFENYIANDPSKLYRGRTHALGDIGDSQLAYVGSPSQLYTDAGYKAFATGAAASRSPMVYVGGNDGMLHAFYADTAPTSASAAAGLVAWGTDAGKEAWAVIPTSVLSKLYALADVAYGANHRFYVDGSPVTDDIYNGSVWKSILVGGLAAGGQGYYALDVTDPTVPKALWEFTAANDKDLGLSFGRPVITKLASGTWVVLLTSGYNNVTGSGNGQGYLYVLNADTGALIQKIGTGVGSTTNPSGLRELTTFANNPVQDNTALWVYGGDLLGNLWRFDLNSGSTTAVLVTTLTAPDGTPQPISTRLNLAEVNGNTFLIVGTGQLLGVSDLSAHQQQTVYSIMDPMTIPTATTPPTAEIDPLTLRASLKPVAVTTTGSLGGGSLTRTVVPCTAGGGVTAAQCASTAGWYMDLNQGLTDVALGSERITVDMLLVQSTLGFVSNIPSATQCSTGFNIFNQLNFITGQPVTTTGVVSIFGSDDLVVGLTEKKPGGGGGVGGGGPPGCSDPFAQGGGAELSNYHLICPPPPPVGKRISWREIVQ